MGPASKPWGLCVYLVARAAVQPLLSVQKRDTLQVRRVHWVSSACLLVHADTLQGAGRHQTLIDTRTATSRGGEMQSPTLNMIFVLKAASLTQTAAYSRSAWARWASDADGLQTLYLAVDVVKAFGRHV